MHAPARFARLTRRSKQTESSLERNELLSKLKLIEEQARLTIDEFPQHLAKERQRLIIALIKHIRWATVRLPS
jgi:hypothetical protein